MMKYVPVWLSPAALISSGRRAAEGHLLLIPQGLVYVSVLTRACAVNGHGVMEYNGEKKNSPFIIAKRKLLHVSRIDFRLWFFTLGPFSASTLTRPKRAGFGVGLGSLI